MMRLTYQSEDGRFDVAFRGNIVRCFTLADALTLKLAEDFIANGLSGDLSAKEELRIRDVLTRYDCPVAQHEFQSALRRHH
jgi:hypothetical protein